MYNLSTASEDFNKLHELYLNSKDDREKVNLYNQMQFLYYVNKKIAKKEFASIEMPSNYIETRSKDFKKELSRFKELETMTREICYYLYDSIYSFKGYSSSKFINKPIKSLYGENLIAFYDEIGNFFKKYFNNDLGLVSDIINDNLLLKRKFFTQEAFIVYLESIKKYIINISYRNKLRVSDARNMVHELGHASVFNIDKEYGKNDPILTESIAYLYELLYMNYYIDKNGYNKEKELGNHFYTTFNVNKLCNHFEGYNTIIDEHDYLEHLKALYGNLIAATIILNSNKSDLYDKVNIIKNNYNNQDGFDVLEMAGIDEDDLIYTARNLKELTRKRLK